MVILSSETESGRLTQVPQLLYYDEYSTQVVAKELAGRVSKEMGVALGEEVSYKVRNDQKVNENKKQTRLVYLTEGVLLRQPSSNSTKNLPGYACVIIDEAHEEAGSDTHFMFKWPPMAMLEFPQELVSRRC